VLTWGWRTADGGHRVRGVDWVNVVVNTTAAVATLAGFTLAYFQLRRTAVAAEGAAEDAREARLISVLQGLREVERAMDASAQSNDHADAERAARDWRQLATEAHGLLKAREGADPELLEQLRDSLAVAARTKGDLVVSEGAQVDVMAATEKLREQIASICDAVGLVGSDIRALRIEREN
jgi:hypothetical protein